MFAAPEVGGNFTGQMNHFGVKSMETKSETVWHQLPAGEVVKLLRVDLKTGLSTEEIGRRQKEFGLNRVTARRGTPAWMKFLQQFNQPLVYILLLAVGVTAFLGEWVDSSVILGVVLVNAVVGFLQEAKAEKAIEALATMVATETTVRRDARKLRVHSEELVPGDVVLLQSGDRVPADLRFIQIRNLHADESALTGESLDTLRAPRRARPSRLKMCLMNIVARPWARFRCWCSSC